MKPYKKYTNNSKLTHLNTVNAAMKAPFCLFIT